MNALVAGDKYAEIAMKRDGGELYDHKQKYIAAYYREIQKLQFEGRHINNDADWLAYIRNIMKEAR